MTNDYKEIVLKYLTGNLPEESSVYDPQFQNVKTKVNDLYNQIKQYFSSRVAYVGFIPSKNNKNQNLDYSILAVRGTLNNGTQESGAIVILDKNYNIVQFISRYSDTTYIGAIQCINIDDKGNYYLIEQMLIPEPLFNYRIVLLNNLAVKPTGSNIFKAVRVNTINIPNQYSWESFVKVYKNEANNKFFAIANRENDNGIVGCELSITNTKTWTYYTSSYTKQYAYAIFDNGYNVYWNSNNELNFQIAVNDFGLVILSKGVGTMVATRYTRTEENNQHGNFIFYSNKYGYYAYVIDNDPIANYYIYKVDLETKQSSLIYSSESAWSSYSAIWLFKNINSIYYQKIDSIGNSDYELSFGLIDNVSIYELALGEFNATSFLNSFCYPNVITEFNKNYIYIQNQNTLFSFDFIWNSNDYNGEPYVSSASLVPNKITIENNGEIFNRNIYNLSSYSNWYTASMQIPNYYLNNVVLDTAKLYSKGNNTMASKQINTTKNIYEELNINFINRFSIIDEENDIENIGASGLLVNSMLNRYNQRYLGKFRINYQDNTSDIKTLSTNELVYTDLSTTYKILLYVDKLISSIDLISQDEYITYKTIDCSNLSLNKYYSISQTIKVE